MKLRLKVLHYCGLTFADGLSTMIMKTENEFVAVIRRDDCRMDFGKIKKAVGAKQILMASPGEFIYLTGLQPGTAQVYNPGLKTFLDKKIFERNYLNGGSGSFSCTIHIKSSGLDKNTS